MSAQPEASPASPRGRDRRHRFPGRRHRLTPRFTDTELAVIREAASAVGVTPTGFCAEATIAAAQRTEASYRDPRREALAALQAELFAVQTALEHVRGEHRPLVDEQLAGPLAAVDNLVSRIHRALR